jgi:hypothetical protein
MASATVSPLDVNHLRARIKSGADSGQGSILSRVFVFPWAPRNTISCLLGWIAKQMRSGHTDRRAMFTYVNPNLGFRAASYRAANWRQDGTQAVVYRYIEGNYVTARESLIRGSNISYSKFLLDPLQVWRCDPID